VSRDNRLHDCRAPFGGRPNPYLDPGIRPCGIGIEAVEVVFIHSVLSQRECVEILGWAERAAASAGVSDVEVIAGVSSEALTRFANNAIHQNVAETVRRASVRVQSGQRTARASTNRFEKDAVERVVAEALAIMRASEPDECLPPMSEPAPVDPLDRHDRETARTTPRRRAELVAEAIGAVERESQTAAGIYATEESVEAVMNSRGVFAMHAGTMARFSITAMTADSSGWAKATATAARAIDPAGLARRAARKASLSIAPRELAPGRYTVILEPAAVLDMAGQMFPDFSGTAMDDQRSFLTGRLGEKIFGANITIDDDARHPLQDGTPFDAEGQPRTRLRLVEAGVARELARSRSNARRHSVAPTGHALPVPSELGETAANIVFGGGTTPLEEMIASTPRGVLVTRLWYIREVDPYEKIMTGMTRDGTFLIEGGEVVCGVRNLRFNESVVAMLNRVEAMSAPVRASGEEAMDMVAPAMKVAGFPFTEVTRF